MPKLPVIWLLAVPLLVGAGLFPAPLARGPAAVTPTPPPPDIPAVVDRLDFGLPAGNGYRPHQIVLNSPQRRLYTLNEGLSDSPAGNTISVLNLDTGRITGLLALNNRGAGQKIPPAPLSLVLDPYRPRLYAITGDRYGDAADTTLTVIDTGDFTVLTSLPGVDAVAPGPNRLYLVSDARLWAVQPDTLAEQAAQPLAPHAFNDTLLLSPQANRLYLQRGPAGTLELFDAGTLAPAGRYTPPGELLQIALDPANRRLLVLDSDGQQATLRAFSLTGQPLDTPAPVAFSADLTYNSLPPVFTDSALYLLDRDPNDYRAYPVRAFNRATLKPAGSFTLPQLPNSLAADPAAGHLYAAFSFPDSFLLQIDPAAGDTRPIYTAQTIVDALAHPDSGRLYVQLNTGILRVLNLNNYREINRLNTGFNTTASRYSFNGHLSLDAGRNRLYLSGAPVRVVDTELWQVTPFPGVNGQLTPDPATNRLYLTLPCQCSMEQCNTYILNARTMTGTTTLFPPDPNPLTAPCVVSTQLDVPNHLLYASIYNGVPGSNSGNYLMMFDVSGPPKKLHTASAISYGKVAFDSPNRRAFAPRYRIGNTFINRFEQQGQSISQTLELVGGQGSLAYDPAYNRLYAVFDTTLQVFDGDLALLAEITLPGRFDPLAFDSPNQRLYLANQQGQLLVVSTSGGSLEPPRPEPALTAASGLRVRVAPGGLRFRIDGNRLYRSGGRGQPWQQIGAGLPGRLIGDVAVSPNFEQDHTLLAGLWHYGQGGGLFRSTDGGDTWRPTTRGLTDLGIRQIAFSPTFARDRTIFVSAAEHGLFRSTNRGDSWAWLAPAYAPTTDRKITHLAVSPNFAADGLVVIGYHTLLRSTDGGDTWQDTGLPPDVTAFSPNFAADGLILMGGAWRSANRGQSWQPAAAGREPTQQTVDLFFSPNFAADRTVYLLFNTDYGPPLRLQRSTDAGVTWESLLGGLPDGFELAAAAVLPGGSLYLTGVAGQEVVVAPDALAWGQIPPDITRLDLQDMAVSARGEIFVANSAAGVFQSTDGGQTWQATGFPIRASELRPARLALAGDGTLFAAAGMAVARAGGPGGSWTYLDSLPPGVAVTSLAVSPMFETDRLVLAGSNYTRKQILRSADGGQSWTVVFDGKTVEGATDISLITFAPDFASSGKIYAWLQDGGLLRSTDRGRSWVRVDSQVRSYAAQSLAVSADGSRLYLGALGGHVLVSTDEGQTWRDLAQNISSPRVWSSVVTLTRQGAILVGTDAGILRSVDGGETWVESSAGLPLNPDSNAAGGVRALKAAGNRLYAALTAGGLFISDDGGQTWRSSAAAGDAPAPTPTPTAGPTPTPALPARPEDCPAAPAYFDSLWALRVSQLGCPTTAQTVTMVEQSFERGRMFWRGDKAAIYVLPDDHTFARFADTWTDSLPAYSCPEAGPPQTPPTPQRGFGKVWCEQPEVRRALGNATGGEQAYEAVVQEFDTGLIFEVKGKGIYILQEGANSWEQP